MNRAIQIALVLLTLAALQPAHAQFGKLKDKLKKKLDNTVNDAKNGGLLNEGKDLLVDQLQKTRATYDSINFNYAIALSDNAGLFENTERFQKHQQLLLQALGTGDDGERVKGLGKVRAAIESGEMLYANNRYRLAEAQFLRARIIAAGNEAIEYQPEYIRLQANLGLLYHTMGRYGVAHELAQEVLELRQERNGVESIPFAAAMNNMAVLLKDEGEYNQAEVYIDSALALNKRLLGAESMPYAIGLNNKAMLFQTIGRNQEAIPLIKEALRIADQNIGQKSTNYQRLLINQALLYQNTGDFANAEAAYLQARALKEKRLGKRHPDYAHVSVQLAALYMQMGQAEQVAPLLTEARTVYRTRFGENHPSFATATSHLGNFYRSQGQTSQAEPLLLRALEIREEQLGPKNPAYVQNEEDLALLYWAQGRLDEAVPLYQKVLQQSISFINAYFPPMSAREKTRYWDRLRPRFERFNAFALAAAASYPQLRGQMYNYHLATKGLLLNTANRVREQVFASGDEQLQGYYNAWVDLKEQLAHLYTYTNDELAEQQANLDSLEQQANFYEKQLSAKSGIFDGGLLRNTVTYQDVRNKLAAGQAAIELIHCRNYDNGFTGTSSYAALIVKHGSQEPPQLVVLPNGDQLDGRYYKYYNNAIQRKVADDISFEQYWQPIDQQLAQYPELVVSLDGVYNQLNLNTLRKADGSYLIAHKSIRVVGSTRDLLRSQPNTNSGGATATMVGYPHYGDAGHIVPLPGTRAEVQTIEGILAGANVATTVYMEKEAAEQQVKQVRNPTILHIATHGFFMQDVPGKQQKVFGVEVEKAREEPLLRSGLMLAGAEAAVSGGPDWQANSANNGILTAFEAMNMHLQQTDIVVLSACETGLGDVKAGEGVYGLQRAFLVAGAGSVVMSLWKVNDEATQLLMTTFYRNWFSTNNKTAAFQQAQLAIKQQYPEPYYWGAFVLIGG